jgi:hypothetical protein
VVAEKIQFFISIFRFCVLIYGGRAGSTGVQDRPRLSYKTGIQNYKRGKVDFCVIVRSVGLRLKTPQSLIRQQNLLKDWQRKARRHQSGLNPGKLVESWKMLAVIFSNNIMYLFPDTSHVKFQYSTRNHLDNSPSPNFSSLSSACYSLPFDNDEHMRVLFHISLKFTLSSKTISTSLLLSHLLALSTQRLFGRITTAHHSPKLRHFGWRS